MSSILLSPVLYFRSPIEPELLSCQDPDADVIVMEDEIIMAMRLLGVRKIDEITPGMVECLKEVWR